MPKSVARVFGEMPLPVAHAARNAPTRLATALALPDLVRANVARQREALSIADRFVVLTESASAILRANAFDAANVSVNRLGISGALRKKPSPRERPTTAPIRVGYVGRFESVKGAEVLARAIALTGSDLPLRVEFRGPVNTPADRDAVERIRALTGGDRRVSIAPAVPPERIGDVLADLDVLCCPAVCHEGGPTIALEALAVGTPVIGSRIGGLAEMIRDDVNGRLVAAGDASSLASLLKDVAASPETTIDRWRAAITDVRTMDDVASDYLTFYAA
jgi:glycosyltransferase involved in cell wall biosynthesis